MATEKLTVEMYLKNKGYIKNVNRATQANKRMQKSSGGASAAIIELGRGASDARFGFHGLGNNLERSTELIGSLIKKSGGLKGALGALKGALLGPAGLVLAITILIAYGPQIINFFKGIVGASTEAKDALDKFTESQRKANESIIDKENKLLQDVNDEIQERLDKISRIEELRKRGQKTLSEELIAERESLLLQQQINTTKISNNIESEKEKERQKKITAEYKKQLKAIRDREDIAPFSGYDGLQDALDLEEGKDLTFSDVFGGGEDLVDGFLGVTDRLPNLSSFGDDINAASDALDSLYESGADEFGEDMEDLNDILRQTGSIFANLSPEISAKLMEIDAAMVTSAEKTQMFSGALINAFESAATQGGNFLENLAKGLMSSLGSVLIQQGTAAIFSGIAKNAIVPGSGRKSIRKGALVVAAGVALKAGSTIGKGSANDSGGGGGSSANRSTATATSITPISTQGSGGDNQLIATIRGQQIRFIQQAADDSYGALS